MEIDPARSTDPRVNRGAFVALTAAALSGVPAMAAMPPSRRGPAGHRDARVPRAPAIGDERHALRSRRHGVQTPHDIVIYPQAGHAFFDDRRASYVPTAAEDAWRRTIAFLTKYLAA